VWAFDHSLSGADAFARSGVSGRAVGRNRFIAPATFQDLKGRNKAIALYKDCASLPRSLAITYRVNRMDAHNGLRFHTPIISGQSAE